MHTYGKGGREVQGIDLLHGLLSRGDSGLDLVGGGDDLLHVLLGQLVGVLLLLASQALGSPVTGVVNDGVGHHLALGAGVPAEKHAVVNFDYHQSGHSVVLSC